MVVNNNRIGIQRFFSNFLQFDVVFPTVTEVEFVEQGLRLDKIKIMHSGFGGIALLRWVLLEVLKLVSGFLRGIVGDRVFEKAVDLFIIHGWPALFAAVHLWMGVTRDADSVFVAKEKFVSVGVPSLEGIEDRFMKIGQCVCDPLIPISRQTSVSGSNSSGGFGWSHTRKR